MQRIVLLSVLWTAVGAVTLEEALLYDIMPPSSSLCDASSGSGTTSFTFDYTSNNAESDWDPTHALRFESNVFLAEMSHVDPDDKKSWKMRMGHGGNPYSYIGAYGEALPPQRHADAPWIDEVWQQVAVSTSLNTAETPYFIHQAGTYTREEELRTRPFYSPNMAKGCNAADRTCTFASMGQQAHVPNPYNSNDVYYNRYKDCGGGVQEVTWMMHNSGPVGSEQWGYFNTPWAGVRKSNLKDMLQAPNRNTVATIIEPINAWGFDLSLPQISTLGGYTIFAEDLPSTLPITYDLPCSPAAGGSIVDCGTSGAIQYVPKRSGSCIRSSMHSDRDGQFVARCQMEGFNLGWQGGSVELSFFNRDLPNAGHLDVEKVLHWASPQSRTYFYFYPTQIIKANGDAIYPDDSTSAFMNALYEIFPTGATWSAENSDFGRPASENNGLAIVYGTDGSFRTRVRIGTSNRDYTVWTLNPMSLRLNPGETFYYRQYLISGQYEGLDAESVNWRDETLQGKYSGNSDYSALRRPVYLMSTGTDGGTEQFGALVADNTEACGAATQKCEGSSVPGDGLRPLFNIKCGTEYYVGSDQYHFDPSTDEFQRLYRCNGHTDDERATWTLLGYFVEGACDFLQNAEYSTGWCQVQDTSVPTVAPTATPSATPTTADPTTTPTATPSATPTTAVPTATPSTIPTHMPNSLPNCGNGVCGTDEDCNTCPVDCVGGTRADNGQLYCCGDGSCAVGYETDGNCNVDCIEVPSHCGVGDSSS